MKFRILFICLILNTLIFADGLVMPTNDNYPKDLLKNRMTKVELDIHGLIIEGKIYQEFVNESQDTTDGVYSYPLPENSKATKFLYWYDDTVYEAVLKVKEQAQNPGHGEKKLAERIDSYIGDNGIKIKLKNIPPNKIQKTELHYISKMKYNNGNCKHEIPLNTKNLIKYPYKNLEFEVNVNSNTTITNYNIPDFSNSLIKQNSDNKLKIELSQPKFYPNRNISFEYSIAQNNLGVDFYSSNNDTTKGHYGLFVKPNANPPADSILPKRMIFLLSNSNDMSGTKLAESVESIQSMIGELNNQDKFNIITFSNDCNNWQEKPVKANSENKDSSQTWLNNIGTSWGSDMDKGLNQSLEQINNSKYNNIIVVFTGGYSQVDPKNIAKNNKYKTGIFPVALGDDISYAQLEMTATQNYGYVTYINQNDNLKDKINTLYNKLSRPILKDIKMEYGNINLTDKMPPTVPSYYAGSYFFTTGRYDSPNNASLTTGGEGVNGIKTYNFNLDFTSQNDTCKFIEKFWAKTKIDRLEWETEIYGETQKIKQELIDLSLDYNIRCKYTAFIADYEKKAKIKYKKQNSPQQCSFIKDNYPNPCNPTTKFKIYLKKNSNQQMIQIYNILGRLVAVIDISHLSTGWHTVRFNGYDINGNRLASGTYIAVLKIDNRVVSSDKINIIK